jgi:predicted nucleic acid-binding protein
MIVADCTLIAQLVIHTSETERAEQIYGADPEWIVPPLWRSELRNVLRMHVVEAGMPLHSALERMSIAEERFAAAEHPVASRDVLAVATKSRCSAYDAEYLSLARELSVPLVTSDRRLRNLFPRVAISPAAFLSMFGGEA